jgi:hypothetical protein
MRADKAGAADDRDFHRLPLSDFPFRAPLL